MSRYWLRNPSEYPRVLSGMPHCSVAWDEGWLKKKRIDIEQFHSFVFAGRHFSSLVVNADKTAQEYTHENHGIAAVYPVWSYLDDSFAALQDMVNGGPSQTTFDRKLHASKRSRPGQEHIIVLRDLPEARANMAKMFYLELKALQEENEEVKFILHGVSSFRVMFGQGFYGTTTDVVALAEKGSVAVPSGKQIPKGQFHKYERWIKRFGFNARQLTNSTEDRLKFSIQSLEFSKVHFNSLIALRDGVNITEDLTVPTGEMTYPQLRVARITSGRRGNIPVDGDKIECDTCSLANTCGFAREGSVCTLPGTEGKSLSEMFQTRDSAQIMLGLSAVLGKNAQRLDRAMQDEDNYGEVDPEVTKLVNQVFSQGVTFAKLVDPSLRGGPKVNVNVGSGAGNVSIEADPKQRAAQIIDELERQGFTRDQITPELIQRFLMGGGTVPQQIAPVVDGEIV